APGYSEIPTGTKAYFDYVNAHGGVNGRTIKYIVKDDGYDPTKTSQVTNELVLQDKVFAMLGALGTPTHTAVVGYLNSQKVPDLAVSSGSITWGDDPSTYPYTFGWRPDYEIEGKIIGKYIAQNMPKAKVGLFLQDDDFGADGEKGLRQYIGKQIVKVTRYTSGNTDVGPQIAALKASGADLVVGFTVPAYTALSQLVSLKVGFKPTWFYSNVGSDPTLVGSLLSEFSKGAVKEASPLEGVYSTQYITGVDNPSDPWIQLWTKVWKKYGGKGALTNYDVYGMCEAYFFVQALQAAGTNPTRDGIVAAVEKQGGDFTGPPLAAYRFSSDSHLGIGGMQVVQIKGGKTKELTPVEVTDLGKTPITEDSSQANDAPPASGIPDVQPAG
ncbi:MAG: ABC transporter substrate-binding protein, partial [Nocardioidaceae bacterium]